MFKVTVAGGPKPIGSNGWQQQVIGVHLHEAPGVESPFAVPVPILIGKGEAGYPAGQYTLDAASFVLQLDKFGKGTISLGRPVLLPLGKGKA